MAPQPLPLASALAGELASDASNPGVAEVLDAALAQFEEIGIRRSTIEDIARRAGIDRVTVYRRVGSKDDVIQAVLVREARRLIDQVSAATAPLPTLEQRIATAFAATVIHIRRNALFNRMVALDGDTFLPRITTQASPLLAMGIAAAVGLLEQAQSDGLLDPVSDPQGISELLIRLVHSFVLTPDGAVKRHDRAALEAFASAHLTPLVMGHARRQAG
ncbi:MAG: TetR/AcrR family transcriptional regulator [Solirubrobacterales bacterium]|nr:TetR/AcrR family transcriptional regulator [Solirubrobacterales bacterium]